MAHLQPAAPGIAIPAIQADRCTGCGRCVAVCPPHVLSLRAGTPGTGKLATLDDGDACTGCALCWVACPFDAITMLRRPGAPLALVAPQSADGTDRRKTHR